jgi:deoxyribodipyrimidine photo-lyase
VQVLPGFLTERGSGGRTVVLAQSEVTSEETAIERRVKAAVGGAGGKMELRWGSTLFHIDDLPFRWAQL